MNKLSRVGIAAFWIAFAMGLNFVPLSNQALAAERETASGGVGGGVGGGGGRMPKCDGTNGDCQLNECKCPMMQVCELHRCHRINPQLGGKNEFIELESILR